MSLPVFQGARRERFSFSGWFSMVLHGSVSLVRDTEQQASTQAKQRIWRLVLAYFFHRLVTNRRF
jgi:hypothetical protein